VIKNAVDPESSVLAVPADRAVEPKCGQRRHKALHIFYFPWSRDSVIHWETQVHRFDLGEPFSEIPEYQGQVQGRLKRQKYCVVAHEDCPHLILNLLRDRKNGYV
jgi:hypothetical protein